MGIQQQYKPTQPPSHLQMHSQTHTHSSAVFLSEGVMDWDEIFFFNVTSAVSDVVVALPEIQDPSMALCVLCIVAVCRLVSLYAALVFVLWSDCHPLLDCCVLQASAFMLFGSAGPMRKVGEHSVCLLCGGFLGS